MLEQLYDAISEKFQDRVKAWDRLVEMLAADQQVIIQMELEHGFEWLFGDRDLAHKIWLKYDPELLKSDYYDHLGEMYVEKILTKEEAKKKGIVLTPEKLAKGLAKITLSDRVFNQDINVLDPGVGSGRLLMAAYKEYPNATLYGVDIDLRLLRIAMTNSLIHNLPAYFLHANTLYHEIDPTNEAGKKNWQYANRWYSCITKLKPRQSTTQKNA